MPNCIAKKPNDFVLLILIIVSTITVIISDSIMVSLSLAAYNLINIFLFKQIRYKLCAIFILGLCPNIIMTFITGLIYANGNSLEVAVQVAIRMISLFACSTIPILHLDFNDITIFAMRKLHCPVKLGYAILMIDNAFRFLYKEFLRIRLAYKMRFVKNINIAVLYTLVISAIRYASISAMSLSIRNLNDKKTFVNPGIIWNISDTILLSINMVAIFIIYYKGT